MVKHIRIVVVVLLLFLPVQAMGQGTKLPLDRVARLSAQVANQEPAVVVPDESPVPSWLEELLNGIPETSKAQAPPPDDQARIPAENVPESAPQAETAALEQELQTTVAETGGKTAQPEDPLFAAPPAVAPIYLSPKLDGEGVWTAENMPVGIDGRPLMYKTVFRPSLDFPNSVVYMAIFDMKRLTTRYFVGETEPGIYQITHVPAREDLSRIVAITNAMWMQQHARGAGAIFRGQVVYPMVAGMATLVVYQDNSVDILDWSDEIPLSLVRDARQLRHLILKDGHVVESVLKQGKLEDSEIGLGGFLLDDKGRSTMQNKDHWFLANRTAFGIRDDGNLVFAMAHHCGTKDLARALALAGCKSAIHGDANIHNMVCNVYFRDANNKIVERDRLSPEQLTYTMKRYDQGYAKDFFAFYEK